MKTYLNILQHILDNGYTKMDRTGTGTIGVFGVTLRHKMSDGFPLLSTKKMFTKGIICELLWFLNGDTNIKYLLENNVHIWSEWPWKNYCTWVKSENKRSGMGVTPLTLKEFEEQILKDESFASRWGGIGDGYGAQWRKWPGKPTDDDGKPLDFTEAGFGDNSLIDYVQPNYDGESAKVKMKPIDQIINLTNSLKNNPLSRRHIVTAWNPAEIENMLLPPCHMLFQLNCRPLTLSERYSNWPDFQNLVAGHDYIKARWTEDKDGKRTYYSDDTFKTPITEEENTANKHAYLDSQNVPKYHLDLMLTQRSCDVFFGIPYNIASYSLLLHMLSQQCNMVPGEFIHSMGDVHIYNNLIEQSKEQLTREPYPLPTLKLNKAKDIFSYKLEDFVFENYQCHPAIKGEIAV